MRKLIYLVLILASCQQSVSGKQKSIYDEICKSLEKEFNYKITFSKHINLNISDSINTLIFNIDSLKTDSVSSLEILSTSSLSAFDKIESSSLKSKIVNIELIVNKNGNQSSLELTSKAYHQVKEQLKTIDQFFTNYQAKKHLENYSLMDSTMQRIPDTTFVAYFNNMQDFKGKLNSWKLLNFKPENIFFENKEIFTNAITFKINCDKYSGEAFFRLPLSQTGGSPKLLGIEM